MATEDRDGESAPGFIETDGTEMQGASRSFGSPEGEQGRSQEELKSGLDQDIHPRDSTGGL